VPRVHADSTASAHAHERLLDVLVIEPDTGVRTSLHEALRARGDRVLVLADGLLALSHLDARIADGLSLPDLIVTDVTIPGFAPLGFAATLRRTGFSMPIIVTTASMCAKTNARARELGALAVLVRPFELHDLLSMVEAWRESR
jgi:DNA-binding response OmpR family regulator